MLVLGGPNTYSGQTIVNNGTLQYNNIGALGNTSKLVTGSGGQVLFNFGGQTITKAIDINGATASGAIRTYAEGNQLTFANSINLLASSTIHAYAGSSTLNFNSNISGAGDLTLSAGGAAITHNNTFSLNVGSSLTYSGNTIITSPGAANAIVKLNGGVLPSRLLTLKDYKYDATRINDAVFDLNGYNQTLSGLTDVAASGGGGRFVVNTSGTQSTLTIDGATGQTFAGVIGVNSGAAARGQTAGAGNIALVKSGSGTQTLSGANTYTGTTTVNGGMLELKLVSANLTYVGGAISINNGATLKLTPGTANQYLFNGKTFSFGSGGGIIDTGTGVNFMNDGVGCTFSTTAGTSSAIVGSSGFNLNNTTVSLDVASGSSLDVLTTLWNGGHVVKNGDGTLLLTGANTYGGNTTINGGTLVDYGSSLVTIPNFGFEAPVVGTYTYTPTGGSWTFGAGTGIDMGGNTFHTTAAPQGSQCGFIQNDGTTISQSITVAAAGTYLISFQAEGRGGVNGPNGIIVRVDGNTVGTWPASAVSQTAWLTYLTSVNLAAGSHTLTFVGNNTLGGDKSSSIDNVQMYQPGGDGSLPAGTAVSLTASGATLDLPGVTQTIGSLAGVAGSSVLDNGSLTVGGNHADTAFAGVISGAGSLTKAGDGTLTLSGANSYSGTTTVNGGTLTISASPTGAGAVTVNNAGTLTLWSAAAFPSSIGITVNAGGAWHLNGTSQTVGTLDGAGSIHESWANAGTDTLTVSGGGTFSGIISGGDGSTLQAIALTVSGGTLTLSGPNTYSGATTVSGGTLALGAHNVLPDATAVSIGSATLQAATYTDTLGTLDVTGSAVVNLGTGAALAFADSHLIDWTGGTLYLTGPFVSGSSLRFGATSGGLTSAQLASISASGFTSCALDANGYLVETTPPTLAGSAIVDNKLGGPIPMNNLVTFTVTFSEDMDAGTIAAADFGNAGDAALTIGTVAEITPGVFTVEVTPTSAGSLRLKVNAGAELQDVAGNLLDTTSAILDNTTITVEAADATPPTLASSDIVDNKSGGPVVPNTLVTYTVTFSEDMDAGTVAADDFGNAGSATFTMGTVAETLPNSGVFTVPVTPTSTGTLQLQVNAGAVLQDAAGNALDTSSAILDGTTLTVDNTPPTLAGSAIVDDQSGGPITPNTLVSYTVSFSEDMDAGTVAGDDFSNAGDAAVTIGTVTETAPGVFSVPVTPTSGWSLRLQVKAGAVLKDAAGNVLDTAMAILDDTTIAVDRSASWNVDADGGWATADNWNPAAAPGSATTDNPDVATFSRTLGAARAVTVDATRHIGGIAFGNTSANAYTLQTGALYLNSGGLIQSLPGMGNHTDTIKSPIVLSGAGGGTFTISADASSAASLLSIGDGIGNAIVGSATGGNTTTLTLNGSNTGANKLGASSSTTIADGAEGGKLAVVKDGPGTWWIIGNNTFTGGLTIKAGTLVHSAANAAVGAGTVTLGDSAGGAQAAALVSGSTAGDVSRPIALAANTTGILTLGGGAGIAATTYSGGVTGNNHLTLDSRGTTLTLATAAIDPAGTLTVKGAGATTIGSTIGANVTGLTKNDAGTLTLAVANAYSGATTIGAGVLRILDLAALGSSAVTASGGQLYIDELTGTLANNLTLSGATAAGPHGAGALVFHNDAQSATLSGTVTLAGATQIRHYSGGGTTTFNNPIGGTGALTFDAGGAATAHNQTWVLKGGSSTYAGDTTITSPGGANAIVRLQGGALPGAGVLTLKDGNASSLHNDAVLDLNGNNQLLAGLTDVAASGGGGRYVMNSSATLATLTIDNSNPYSYAGVIGLNNSSGTGQLPGSGNIALVKQGAGTLTLSGNASTFTGNLTINQGTVLATGGGLLANPTASALGNPQTAGRQIIVGSLTTLNFGASDVLGNASSTPQVTLVVNGGAVRNNGAFFTTLGPVTLNGGTLTSYGGVSASYPSFALGGTVTVGGGAASTINVSGSPTYPQMTLGSAGGSGTATTFNVADATSDSAGDLIVSAVLQNGGGNNGLTKTGLGTLLLSGANTYSGATAINGGTLLATKAAALPGYNLASKVSVVSGATLAVQADSGGWTAGEIDSLLGATTAAFASGSTFGIEVTGANTFTYANDIGATQAAKSFVKTGAGTLTLSGANAYSGATTVNLGTLALGANDVLPTTAVSIGGATLNASTYTDTVGTLDVTAGATINLGAGAALAFADSSAIDWTGGTLNIAGTFVSGASLRFGTDSSGLTPAQLALISADAGYSSFALDGSGYLTAMDTVPPTVSTLSPADNATGVPMNFDLVITFNESVQKGTGNVTLKRISDGSVVETIPVTSGAVTVNGAQVTIDPASNLRTPTSYYVEIDAGAIEDLSGNAFAGIAGNTTWNFTTSLIAFVRITGDADCGISASKTYTHKLDFGLGAPGALINAVQFSAYNLAANGSLNFSRAISSGTANDHAGNAGHNVSGNLADLLTDMYYNGSCAAGGTTTWTVSGLTPGVAYDTRIYVRQWAAAGTRNANLVFDPDGPGPVSDSTGVINEDDATTVGLPAANTAYFISYHFTAVAGRDLVITATQPLATWSWHLYGLTTEVVPDTTPPTLASSAIVDDQSGGPVEANTLVTYTATFGEDMDAGTVAAEDFENAGSSAIDIGTITETTPGVFTVQVTPASVGTLRLQIKADAVLKDVSGNNLVTIPLIADNDTLTVNPDTTPPTLVGIADDKGGGPILANSLVTYTVTFSEDMDASTIDADDLGNAGSAAVNFVAVTETTPGVFSVQVAPTTAGSLQLKVNQNAVLKDTAGNDLVTASALADDTTLTVVAPIVYWDLNGATAGAGGTTPAGTWDAANPSWNVAADGTGATAAWMGAGQTAVFAAGTDASGIYSVAVDATKDIGGLRFEEGTVTLSGGAALRLVTDSTANVGAGLAVTVATAIAQDASSRSLTKTGDGALTLSGLNTYTGDTTVNGGILEIGGAGSLNGGAYAGAIAIAGGATFSYNSSVAQALSGVISDAGGLTKSAAAELTLSGTMANTYTGDTTISAGTLTLAKTAGIMAVGGNIVVSAGGTLKTTVAAANQIADAASITIAADGMFYSGIVDTVGAVTATGGGSGNGRFNPGSGSALSLSSLTLINTISSASYSLAANSANSTMTIGPGGLTMNNAIYQIAQNAGTYTAKVVLNGNFASTGASQLTKGTGTQIAQLDLGASARTFDITGTMSIAPVIIGAGGGIAKIGSGVLTLTGVSTYTGPTTVNAGTLKYGANNAIATGAVTVSGGTAVLDVTGYSDSVGTVTLAGGGTLAGGTLTSTGTFEMQNGSASTVLAGPGIALNKTTAGTVTLSAENTYSGNTTVNAGTLRVSNGAGSATGGGAVTVKPTATLEGAGRILGPATVETGGRLAPGGAGVGMLTVGTLTLDTDSVLDWDIDPSGADDAIAVVTALTLPAHLTLNINPLRVGEVSGTVLFNVLASYTGPEFIPLTVTGATGNLAAVKKGTQIVLERVTMGSTFSVK